MCIRDSLGDTVAGLDVETGTIRWSTPVHDAIEDPLDVVGEHVLVRRAATFDSLRAATGELEWSIASDKERSIVGHHGSVVEWRTTTAFGALSLDDGRELWRKSTADYPLPERKDPLPVLFVHNVHGRFDVLDPQTGNVVLSAPFTAASVQTADGWIVASTKPKGSSGPTVLFAVEVGP